MPAPHPLNPPPCHLHPSAHDRLWSLMKERLGKGELTTRVFFGNVLLKLVRCPLPLTPTVSPSCPGDCGAADRALPAPASTAQGGSRLRCLSKFRSFRLKSKLSSPAALGLQNKFFHDSYVRRLGPSSLPYLSPAPLHPRGKCSLPLNCVKAPLYQGPHFFSP